MEQSIVCGIDGSQESRAGLRVAAQLSSRLGIRLVVAHVAPATLFPPPYGTTPIVEPATEADFRAAEELLARVTREEGVPDTERRALHGVPAECLADLADEEGAAFIVVGSRGRGAFRGALLGSVSQDLLGIARCPVLVLPPGAAASDGSEIAQSEAALRAGQRTDYAAPALD